MNRSQTWAKRGLYISLIVAWAATMGSLYFSEVSRFTPCTFCWYQRILMYPLAGLLTLGILRRDQHLPFLVLPFSLLGQGVAVYHFLLQKTTIFSAQSTCGLGVTCATVWIDWFGFVTIPLLAIIGFMAITMGMLIVIASGVTRPNQVYPYRWPRWPVPIVILLAIGLYIVGAVRAGQMVIPLPEVQFPVISSFSVGGVSWGSTATPEPTAAPTATPTSLEEGDLLYAQACASCHGAQGEGVDSLGTPLVDSPYVADLTDSEMLILIQDGRPADQPDNRTGFAKPPRGGQSELADEQIGEHHSIHPCLAVSRF